MYVHADQIGQQSPLWSPAVPLFPDGVIGEARADAGDHKGPPRSSQPPSPLRMLMGFSLG